jgi:hypothetical protein
MIHQSRRMPTTEPMTMPAMAPPSRPELEVEPVSASTRTVVVGCWRPRRREMPLGRVGVGAMMCSVVAQARAVREVRVLWMVILDVVAREGESC